MSTRRAGSHVIDVLFILALFSVFTAASLVIVFIGADVYANTIRQADENFEVNTTLTFVSTAIRQHDTADSVRLDYIDDIVALVLSRTFGLHGEVVLETWLHHHEGILREIQINPANRSMLAPGVGHALINIHEFSFTMLSQDLIEITAASEGGSAGRTLVALRSR